ncbi:MAG: winged helix-turn-helix transcriptional regulator [Alphaproteobacteria bacterium]
MRWSEIADAACPLARTLAVVGDRWTMLIVREAFFGMRRYEDFQRYTGAAPKLLADRLARLVEEGVLERRRYQDRPPRHEYRLTAKGLDLYPALIALSRWGDRWLGEGFPPAVRAVHKPCGRRLKPQTICAACGEPLSAHDVDATIEPHYAAERARLAAAADRSRK